MFFLSNGEVWWGFFKVKTPSFPSAWLKFLCWDCFAVNVTFFFFFLTRDFKKDWEVKFKIFNFYRCLMQNWVNHFRFALMSWSPLSNAVIRTFEKLSIDVKRCLNIWLNCVEIVSTHLVWTHLNLSVYLIAEKADQISGLTSMAKIIFWAVWEGVVGVKSSSDWRTERHKQVRWLTADRRLWYSALCDHC